MQKRIVSQKQTELEKRTVSEQEPLVREGHGLTGSEREQEGTVPPRPKVEFIRDWIPKWVGFGIAFFFLLVFQFCQPIYMPSATEMLSETGWMREDILFAGFCAMTGMSLIFPALFQLKFHFSAKSVFLAMIPIIIACNLITMHTGSRLVLCLTSLIGGTARMFCIFECFSNIQLDITPTREMNTWFMILYSVILGVMQFTNILQANIVWHFNWMYINYFIIGVLLITWLIVILLCKRFHAMPPIPIRWLDWYGWILWIVVMLSIIFICQYGDHFDWFYSPYIRLAAVIGATALLLNIKRMHTYKAPYICPEAFRYRDVFTMLILFLLYDIFKGTQTLFQNEFAMDILGFDRLNTVRINLWGWAGIMFGGIVSYVWVRLMKGSIRMLVVMSFACATFYQLIMYFVIDQRTSIEYMFVPAALLTAGEMIIYCALTMQTFRVVPLYHFFQAMTIFGFSRVACASSIAGALFGRIFKFVLPKNFALVTAGMDAVSPDLGAALSHGGTAMSRIYGLAMNQAMLASMKEIIGWTAIAGVIVMLVVLGWKRPRQLPAVFGRIARRLGIRRKPRKPLAKPSPSDFPFLLPDQM